MTSTKRLHLGAFMRPATIHTGAWRYPGAWPDVNFKFPKLRQLARKLEEGKFDAFFMADHMAVLNMPFKTLRRSHTATSFEPFTLLSALAASTEHIGLAATASTTFDAPYHIARRFASLDHISGGRAAWNIVTTSNPDAALNFGMTDQMEHGARYRRAREFYDVVTGLWDSWADDAFIRDVESGVFFDPDKMHVLDHHGEFLDVRGPLNIGRPIQGWPVIVQAGASEAGRQLAAETAELVFTSQPTIEAGRKFYADVKRRMALIGRDPARLKVLPACLVVVGDTIEDARRKRALLDTFVHEDSGIASLSISLGCDASQFDLDGPLPEIPETNAGKSSREKTIEIARREGLTVRQLAQRIGGHMGLSMVGTPASIADTMQDWLETEASDGFTIQFPYLPAGLFDFVDQVVPELQRRGLFRRQYEGATLRENLGLPRPENRFSRPRRRLEPFCQAPGRDPSGSGRRTDVDVLRATPAMARSSRLRRMAGLFLCESLGGEFAQVVLSFQTVRRIFVGISCDGLQLAAEFQRRRRKDHHCSRFDRRLRVCGHGLRLRRWLRNRGGNRGWVCVCVNSDHGDTLKLAIR